MKSYFWLIVGAVIITLSAVIGRSVVLVFMAGVNLAEEYDLALSSSITSVTILGTLIFVFGAAKTLIYNR